MTQSQIALLKKHTAICSGQGSHERPKNQALIASCVQPNKNHQTPKPKVSYKRQREHLLSLDVASF